MADFTAHSRLLVPFGTKDWSVDRVNLSLDDNGDPIFECPVSHVVLEISQGMGLRLNSDWYRLFDRPPMHDLQTAEDRFAYINEHMPIYCDVWDKYQQLFLDRYFKFIAQTVENKKAELQQKLSGMERLFTVKDWLFSAFLPLPQAIVYVPRTVNSTPYNDADMIRVPILFWTGQDAYALFFKGNDSGSSRVKTIYSRLEQGGINVLEIEQSLVSGFDTANFSQFLPEIFGQFWQGETLPIGPFQPLITDPVV